MFGDDQDDILIAPWTTIKYRISNQSGNSAGQQAASSSAASASSSSAAVNTLSNLYPTATGNGGLYPAVSTVQQADTPTTVRFSNVDQIICAAGSPAGVGRAVEEITALLHQRHHVGNHVENDFNVQSATEFADTLGQTTTKMANLLLSVAVLSLLVGGVGIMNIMLVSVTERTPRDRPAAGRGGPRPRHPPAVPGRGGHPVPVRRCRRHRPGPARVVGRPRGAALPDRDQHPGHRRQRDRLGHGRRRVRVLPRRGRPPGSTRSTPCGTSEARSPRCCTWVPRPRRGLLSGA